MATSSRGQSGSNFALKMIIGFAVVITVIIVALLFTKELDYDAFETISTFEETTTQPESDYLVYFYSDSCGYCATIKNDVLAFADSNEANMKLYLANTFYLTGTNTIPNLTGTPGIVRVTDGVIVAVETGALGVLQVFEDVESE